MYLPLFLISQARSCRDPHRSCAVDFKAIYERDLAQNGADLMLMESLMIDLLVGEFDDRFALRLG